jgi:uncharacterized membrane protein
MPGSSDAADIPGNTDHDLVAATIDDVPGKAGKKRTLCAISSRETPKRMLMPLAALRPELQDRILKDHPGLSQEAMIGRSEIDRYRGLYFEELIQSERGEVSQLEKEVADSLARHETISENIEESFSESRSLGERLADGLASFGGSWSFLIIFAVILTIWMAINAALGERGAFDPYPFILLNLVLSCIAAIQAPIIMMSQKRQEMKDRARSLSDYQVNLKAELEIRHLHEKMDHLLQNQWQRLTDIQRMQVEMLQERTRRR